MRSVMVSAQVLWSWSRGFEPRRMHHFLTVYGISACRKKLKVIAGIEPATSRLRSAEDATALAALMVIIIWQMKYKYFTFISDESIWESWWLWFTSILEWNSRKGSFCGRNTNPLGIASHFEKINVVNDFVEFRLQWQKITSKFFLIHAAWRDTVSSNLNVLKAAQNSNVQAICPS